MNTPNPNQNPGSNEEPRRDRKNRRRRPTTHATWQGHQHHQHHHHADHGEGASRDDRRARPADRTRGTSTSRDFGAHGYARRDFSARGFRALAPRGFAQRSTSRRTFGPDTFAPCTRDFSPPRRTRRDSAEHTSTPHGPSHHRCDRDVTPRATAPGRRTREVFATYAERRAHRTDLREECRTRCDEHRSASRTQRANLRDERRTAHHDEPLLAARPAHASRRPTPKHHTAARATREALTGADRTLRKLTNAYLTAVSTPNPTHHDQARAILTQARRDLHTILTPQP